MATIEAATTRYTRTIVYAINLLSGMDHSISRDPGASASGSARKAALRRTLMAARHSANPSAAGTDARIAGSPPVRALERLPERLLACLEHLAPRCLAFYWPINDEVDLRGIIAQWLASSAQQNALEKAGQPGQAGSAPHFQRMAALPVIRTKDAPMVFHRWCADMPMQEGAFRIPVPAQIEVLVPDLLLVPCVGFDRHCYRLGYGGGFYDRTLAALSPRPATLGIALSCTAVDALPVEAHDIPLDGILTEDSALGSVTTVF